MGYHEIFQCVYVLPVIYVKADISISSDTGRFFTVKTLKHLFL